jgi:hypothetical protein
MSSRRSLLASSALAGAACSGEVLSPRASPSGRDELGAAGDFVGTAPFLDGGVVFHEKVSQGWNARLYFDLAKLTREHLIVSHEAFSPSCSNEV